MSFSGPATEVAGELQQALRATRYLNVGARMWRTLKLRSIEDGFIHLTGKEHKETDPSCCPSNPIDVRYFLADETLQETGER